MKPRDRSQISRSVFLGRVRQWIAGALLVALPLLFVAAGVLALDAMKQSRQQVVQSALLGGDLSVALPGSSDYRTLLRPFHDAETLWRDRGRASLHAIVPAAPVQSASATTSSQLEEADWRYFRAPERYRFVAGGYPLRAEEVALSEPVARALHVQVGSTLQVAYAPNRIKVVGTFAVTSDTTTRSSLLGPGTIVQLRIDPQIATRIPIVGSALLQSTTGQPSARTLMALATLGPVTTPEDVPSPQPLWITQPALVSVPFLILISVVAVVGIGMRFRRTQRNLNILIGMGVSRKDSRAMLIESNLILLAISATIGLAGGIAGGFALRPLAASLAHTDLKPASVPWLALLVPVCALACVVTVCTVAIAQRTIDTSRNTGAAARPSGESAPVAYDARKNLSRFVASSIALGLLFCLPRSPIVTGAATVVGAVLLLTTVPTVWRLLSKFSKALPYQWSTALAFARGDQGRSIGLIALCLFAVAIPVTLNTVSESYGEANDKLYQPSVPAGQVDVKPSGNRLSPLQLSALNRAADSKAVPVRRTISSSSAGAAATWVLTSTANGDAISRDILVVDSRSTANTVLGWKMADSDWMAIQSGSVLWLDPQFRGSEGFKILDNADGSASAAVPVQARAPERPANNAAVYQAGAVVSAARAEQLSLPVETVSYRFPHAARHFTEIQKVASGLLIVPSDVQKDDGAPNIIPLSLRTTTAMSVILTLILASMAVLASRAAQRRERIRLSILGAASHQVHQIFFFEAAMSSGIGAIFGLVTGIAIANANIATGGVPLVVEWQSAWSVTVAVVLATLVPSSVGLLASRMPVISTRR